MTSSASAALQIAKQPSFAQREAGNYKKGHLSFHGLNIAIENPKGSKRHGIAANGRKWTCTMPADYGYIKRTEGADGDHVDCYVGPHRDSHVVFVVNQHNPGGGFDEHKCLLGFRSEAEATKVYDAGFSDGSGPRRRAGMQTLSLHAFKEWLRKGETKKPIRIARAGGGEVTKTFAGPLHSHVPGRTDHLPMHVASGSYVLPADVVSGYGEGNTMAAFKVLRRLFGGLPYENSDTPYGQSGTPYNEPLSPKASGGAASGVPVVVAGGEYVLSPKQVAMVGNGDLDTGHRVLDQFVLRSRKKLIHTLKNLPGPKKD